MIEQLKRDVKMEIQSCPLGMELNAIEYALQPNASFLKYQHIRVRDDLMLHLQRFRVQRIDLFGSTVIGIAFKGQN